MRLINDSSGRKSWHLTLAIPALIVGTVWFIIGGMDVTVPGGFHFIVATKTGSDYALYVTPWLSCLGWRDYMKGSNASVPPSPTA